MNKRILTVLIIMGILMAGVATYSYAADTIVPLTATPSSGFEFQYWVVSGGPHGDTTNLVILDNPLDTHSVVGEAYTYQPVFVPDNAPAAETGIPDIYFYAAIGVLVVIAVIGLGVALMYRSRGKK